MGELDLIHLNGHWRFGLKAKQTGFFFFLMAAWKTLLSSPFFFPFSCVHTCQKGDRCPGWRSTNSPKAGETLMARGVKPGRNTCFDWPKTLELPRSWQLHSKVNRGGHSSSSLWSRVVSVFSASQKQLSCSKRHYGRTTEDGFSLCWKTAPLKNNPRPKKRAK